MLSMGLIKLWITKKEKLEKIGKGKAMMKIYCDKCGEEITGIPLKMLPMACQSLPADVLDELLLLKEPLRYKVFCKGCIAEIADFALNKNTCDEYAEQKGDMGEKEILRYLFLVDRRLDIISSGINWKPEYEEELKGIDTELSYLRELVDTEHVKREQTA